MLYPQGWPLGRPGDPGVATGSPLVFSTKETTGEETTGLRILPVALLTILKSLYAPKAPNDLPAAVDTQINLHTAISKNLK